MEGIWSVQDVPPGLKPNSETFFLNIKGFIVLFARVESLDYPPHDVG